MLGAGVVSLSLGIAAKFLLLLFASIATTLTFYRFAVRPFWPTRLLLGMRSHTSGARGPRVAPTLPGRGRGRGWLHVSLLTLLFLPLVPGSATASHPAGLWWVEGGYAQVEIRRCTDTLCGQVVWVRHPFDAGGCELRDVENPDLNLRGRPVVGMTILRHLRASRSNPDEWSGGEIYDPSSGRSYDAVAEMEGPDRLRMRGYLGIWILGRTTTWIRVGSQTQCRDPG